MTTENDNTLINTIETYKYFNNYLVKILSSLLKFTKNYYMKFIFKKTTELTKNQIELFCSLFNRVFNNFQKNPESFKEQYLNTALGYSFHSLMFSDEELVGAHNVIPVNYKFNGENMVFCVGTDTMIKENFRNLANLKQLIKQSDEAIKADGVDFVFGFPNENSYAVLKRVFKYKDIGCLSTYILPYRIGGIKPALKFLNPLSILSANLLSCLSKLRTKSMPINFLIDKDRETQSKYRLKWFGGNYKVSRLTDFTFIYRIFMKDNIRTAFLIDFDKVCPINVSAAVRYIIKMDSKNFDLIIYVGFLPFNAFPLIKIPKRFEPKKFNFHGKFLDTAKVDESFFEIKNWNVNLSCYDLV